MEYANNVEMNQDMRNIPNEPEELSQWHRLPYHILLKIHSNLTECDRFSMPMVCRNWAVMFERPSLWRRINFPLFQTTTLNSVELLRSKEKDLIQKYGHLVKHLIVKDIRAISLKDDRKQRENLELLYSKTQLEYLELEHIKGNMKSSLEYRKYLDAEEILSGKEDSRDRQPTGPGVFLYYWKTSLNPSCLDYFRQVYDLSKDIMEYIENDPSLQIIGKLLPPSDVLQNLWIRNKKMKGSNAKCFLNHLLNRDCNKNLKEIKIKWQYNNDGGHVLNIAICRRPKSEES